MLQVGSGQVVAGPIGLATFSLGAGLPAWVVLAATTAISPSIWMSWSPTQFGSLGYPEPDGVPPQRLVDLVSRLDNVVGSAITEHMPTGTAADADDAKVIAAWVPHFAADQAS